MQWSQILEIPLFILRQPDVLLKHLKLQDSELLLATKISTLSLVLLGEQIYKPTLFKEDNKPKISFNDKELIYLFSVFVQNPMIKSKDLKAIATYVALSERSVRGWFYNKRSDLKEGKLIIPGYIQDIIGTESIIQMIEAFQQK